jgi:hypothetical protein
MNTLAQKYNYFLKDTISQVRVKIYTTLKDI